MPKDQFTQLGSAALPAAAFDGYCKLELMLWPLPTHPSPEAGLAEGSPSLFSGLANETARSGDGFLGNAYGNNEAWDSCCRLHDVELDGTVRPIPARA
jgi:hypothetical protein